MWTTRWVRRRSGQKNAKSPSGKSLLNNDNYVRHWTKGNMGESVAGNCQSDPDSVLYETRSRQGGQGLRIDETRSILTSLRRCALTRCAAYCMWCSESRSTQRRRSYVISYLCPAPSAKSNSFRKHPFDVAQSLNLHPRRVQACNVRPMNFYVAVDQPCSNRRNCLYKSIVTEASIGPRLTRPR